MYWDWNVPRTTRCLFCLPLRHGLLAFGYISLIFTLTMLGYLGYQFEESTRRVVLYRGTMLRADASILAAVCTVETVLLLLLIVGAHKKRILYLKLYLVYGAVSTMIALLIETYVATRFTFEQIALVLCGTVIQLYVLILVRSQIQKLEEDKMNYLHCSHDDIPSIKSISLVIESEESDERRKHIGNIKSHT